MRVLVMVACMWAQALVAGAQEQAEPAEYAAVIDQALSEYTAHNFAEARALFLQAHELYPNARTLRGLGMVEFELKNYGESIARLEQALSSTVRPLEGELRPQTEELLARSRAFVARYELELKPTPKGTRIVVDGVPIDVGAGQALTLTVGEHTLQVEAPGYHDEKRALSVKGGEQKRLVIELRQAQTGPEGATATTPGKKDKSVWASPWLWTGVGAVVVGGVITAVVLATGSSDPETADPIAGDIGGVVQTLRLQ